MSTYFIQMHFEQYIKINWATKLLFPAAERRAERMAGSFARVIQSEGSAWEQKKRFNTILLLQPSLWLALVFVLTLTACSLTHRVLEFKDTGSFAVQQTSVVPVTLKLSGLALHSALGVQSVTPVQKGDTTQILVNLVLVSKGLSGGFEYEYVVPPEIDRVTFGKENTLIWSRDGLAE